jgi:hypothetical protein
MRTILDAMPQVLRMADPYPQESPHIGTHILARVQAPDSGARRHL